MPKNIINAITKVITIAPNPCPTTVACDLRSPPFKFTIFFTTATQIDTAATNMLNNTSIKNAFVTAELCKNISIKERADSPFVPSIP